MEAVLFHEVPVSAVEVETLRAHLLLQMKMVPSTLLLLYTDNSSSKSLETSKNSMGAMILMSLVDSGLHPDTEYPNAETN